MPLPIDVGKVVVWGGRPNSVCGLSCHISCHGTESMLLKKISDVVKETWVKMVKEFEFNLQNKHAAAHWCWQGSDKSGWPNSLCGLSFHLSHHGTESMLLKKLSDVVKETWAKMWRKLNLTLKINMPLPINVGKVLVQGGRPNSVCGLSFDPSHGTTIDDELKNVTWLWTICKNVIDLKTHHKNIPTPAYWC